MLCMLGKHSNISNGHRPPRIHWLGFIFILKVIVIPTVKAHYWMHGQGPPVENPLYATGPPCYTHQTCVSYPSVPWVMTSTLCVMYRLEESHGRPGGTWFDSISWQSAWTCPGSSQPQKTCPALRTSHDTLRKRGEKRKWQVRRRGGKDFGMVCAQHVQPHHVEDLYGVRIATGIFFPGDRKKRVLWVNNFSNVVLSQLKCWFGGAGHVQRNWPEVGWWTASGPLTLWSLTGSYLGSRQPVRKAWIQSLNSLWPTTCWNFTLKHIQVCLSIKSLFKMMQSVAFCGESLQNVQERKKTLHLMSQYIKKWTMGWILSRAFVIVYSLLFTILRFSVDQSILVN